jgi:hypothetical protein
LEDKGVIYTRVLPAEDDETSPIGRWVFLVLHIILFVSSLLMRLS